jgi:hypothetical protein
MAANTLTGEVKLFITHLNARFHTPTEVVELVKAQYDIDVTPQNVQAYDPTKWTGKGLSADLRGEFERERERFRAAVTDIPVANPAYRLRMIQHLIDRQKQINPALTASLMEQAAKDAGGAFTNKHDVTTGGKPIEPAITADALRETIRAELAKRGKPAPE